MAKCKRCGLKTALDDKDIAKMVNEVTHMKGVTLVTEEEYNRRISYCAECEKLQYGSTCMLCGAVVQVRCRLENGKCPWKKW